MRIRKFNYVWGVLVSLLFMWGCGPSGSIPTNLEEGSSAFAVDVLCDGVACGDNVPSDAMIGVKVTPGTIEASAFSLTLVCDGIDYPLTPAGEEIVGDSKLFAFTHAAIPQVRPCTITIAKVAAAADMAKSDFLGDGINVEKEFAIACDPTGSDDFNYAPTLEKCWKPAIIEMGAGGQQQQQFNGGGAGAFNVSVGKAAGGAFAIRTTWDDMRLAGVTVEIRDGALYISAATGADLVGKFGMIYKSFDPGMPTVTTKFFDNGMDLRPVLDKNGQPTGEYSTNELYALVTGDNANLADTCTFQMSAKGLPSNLQMGGGMGGAEPPSYVGVNDWIGMKLLTMQPSIQQAIMMNGNIAEAACGFETTDSAEVLMEKLNSRTNAVRQAVPVNCIYENASTWTTGIYGSAEAREYTYSWGLGMQDHVWQDKFGESTTIASDYFETGGGILIGFMYKSEDSSGAFVREGVTEPFVPFTLMVDNVKINGAVANYE